MLKSTIKHSTDFKIIPEEAAVGKSRLRVDSSEEVEETDEDFE
jgi:hypothetical protein